ncbi:MAG: CYTH domain-containing protein [Calditrichia bacterium]
MGKEIERKFLVKGDDWKKKGKGTVYRQGYLSTVKERVVRVRTVNDKGFLTIKGINRGATRLEFEYEIPVADAKEMLEKLCLRPLIEKTRYVVEYGGLKWEVDEFAGENEGLILAEVELEDEQQKVELPDWIGEEVTGDPRYFNSNLIKNPYTSW